MKKLICILFFALAVPVLAQGSTATWNQSNVASVAQAQSFTYKLYVTPSGGTTTTITLTGVVCTGTAPNVTCTAPVTVSTVTGTKTEISATDPISGLESAHSVPFISPAAVPTTFKIT